jgi:hypothetical protein
MKKLHVIFILALVLVTANMAEASVLKPKKPGKHKSVKKSKKKKSGYYFNFQH